MRPHSNFLIVFLCLFALSFSLLFLLEGPWGFIPYQADFSSFIPAELLVEDSWYGVYFQEAFLGYSHSLMRIQREDEGGGYLLENSTHLKLPAFGVVAPFNLDTRLELASNYRLRAADFKLQAQSYFLKGTLKRQQGGLYDLLVKTPTQSIEKTISLGQEVINPLWGPLTLNYVPLKKRVSLVFYDPLRDRRTKVFLQNQGRQPVELAGETKELYLIDITVDQTKGRLFVDEQGRMLKEEFLGFTFVKEDPLALRKKKFTPPAEDLSGYFTLAAALPDQQLAYLKVKLKGLPPDYREESFNQKLEEAGDSFIIEVSRRRPGKVGPGLEAGAQWQDYLKEDDFIKFSDPRLQRTVAAIVGQEQEPWLILQKLSAWIDKSITKAPTLTFPNTLDVLKARRGDCNELSALLVGFLRSQGIPAYVNIGLVYQEGRFFYHAWPSVYIGGWFDTDPALGQLVADARRIKLMRGFVNQFEIFRFLGKLEIEVLEYRRLKAEDDSS